MLRSLPLLMVFALSGCGLLGKRVSEDDCEKWDKHYREALEETAKKHLAKCKDSPAAKGWLKNLEENIATSADGLAQGCHAVMKVGTFTSEEEKCFLDSNDAKKWGSCALKPTSAISMYAKSGEGWMKGVEGVCKGSDDDEDDEDAPKKPKKKKKKADDDE